nr:MAG TPA: hypothetical protein [Caudoviricetes sp.]
MEYSRRVGTFAALRVRCSSLVGLPVLAMLNPLFLVASVL